MNSLVYSHLAMCHLVKAESEIFGYFFLPFWFLPSNSRAWFGSSYSHLCAHQDWMEKTTGFLSLGPILSTIKCQVMGQGNPMKM
jgi:hypothetical protein